MTTRKTASCEACALASQAQTYTAANAVSTLDNIADIRSIAGELAPTATSHEVERLLANYRLTSDIACSLPDRTPHRYGHIIRTRCGLVMNIGNRCGQRLVAGLDVVLKRDRELGVHESRLVQIRSAPEVIARAEEAARRVVALHHFVHGVQTQIPDLYYSLARAARNPKANRVDVHVRPVHGRPGWTTESVVAVGLFSETPAKPSAGIRELAKQVDLICKERPTPSETDAKAMAKQINQLIEATAEAERWATGCEAFFTQSNMTTALHLGSIQGVRVEGATFVTSTGARIGLNGRSA